MTRKEKFGCVLAGVIFLGMIPFPYQASPAWQVKVIDDSGTPLQGMTVRLSYTNYSAEQASHEEDQTTDAHGIVVFPPHRSSASTLRRVYYTLRSAGGGAHSSFGPDASVFTFGQNREGFAVDHGHVTIWNGRPDHMDSTIVAALRQD